MSELGAAHRLDPRHRAWLRIGVVLAALLVLAGVVLLLLPTEQTTVGWFAYAPLPETVFVPDAGVLLSPRAVLGLVLATLGALALAAWGGWAFARRGLARS
ncbi:hypothetical protein [Microterricola pindariensis]|uniref:Uncharacterized protein n=1 Tax=Microterricola pindariensis TaxID=478010 RepID=A0ABX5AYZ2_9MICO|nr:hypothetical protein [Microterricola pindariensis]PPL20133.1 hypothetical protein GY24_02085 [Microterricola pindariensis]